MLFSAFAVPKTTTILLEGKFVRLQLWLVFFLFIFVYFDFFLITNGYLPPGMHLVKDDSRPLLNRMLEESKAFYWCMTLRTDGLLMVYVDGLRKLMRFLWSILIYFV